MAGAIILTGSDKRIKMSNNQWARRIGTNWQQLRLGMRLGIRDGGGGIGATPRFAFGLCSGTENIMGDASATHFVGFRTIQSSWTRKTSADKIAYVTGTTAFPSGFQQLCRQVGATITQLSTTYPVNLIGPADLHWTTLYIDFYKPGTHWRVRMRGWGVSADGNPAFHSSDPTKADFLAEMITTDPTISGDTSENIFDFTDTSDLINEGDGELDSFNVFYNVASPELEISDIAVARLA